MGRVLVPAVLNHAQARINYGTGTAFFAFCTGTGTGTGILYRYLAVHGTMATAVVLRVESS